MLAVASGPAASGPVARADLLAVGPLHRAWLAGCCCWRWCLAAALTAARRHLGLAADCTVPLKEEVTHSYACAAAGAVVCELASADVADAAPLLPATSKDSNFVGLQQRGHCLGAYYMLLDISICENTYQGQPIRSAVL